MRCVNLERKFTSVSLPTQLISKIKKRIKNTGFTSVSSYVGYVLRTIESEGNRVKEPFTKEDEKRLKKKLRALGYM